MQTIFPILRYEDARAAIRFLCDAFGFEVIFATPETGATVRHAQLRVGDNIVMLGSVRPDEGLTSPQLAGAGTQALYVYVEDPDAHCKRAQAAGARVISPPADTDFGAREYHALDVEGHRWAFGTFLPGPDPRTST